MRYDRMFKQWFLCFWMVWCCVSALCAQNKADSIITEVIKFRDMYSEYIREYEAQVYIKGNTHVNEKNRLSRYAPDFLYWDKKDKDSFVEALVNVHYTSPNYFKQHIQAINGSRISANDIRERLMQFLNINIYSPFIFHDRIFLPGIRNVFNYYRFEYVTSSDTLGHTIHQIRVRPKIRSQKLITGDFYIVDGSWTFYRINIRGKWEMFDFRIDTEFGLYGDDFLLPSHSTVTFRMNLLGNEIESRYFSQFDYQSVKLYDGNDPQEASHYDLSNYYNIWTDSIPFVRDSVYWAERRPIPLSVDEESLWNKRKKLQQEIDSMALDPKSWNFVAGLVAPMTLEHNDVKYTYSGLLNPFKLGYSKLDGIVYWQQFKIRRTYQNGRQFYFHPNIGILFQRKQIYFNTPSSWVFAPAKFGEVEFNFGNRNQSYNLVSPDKPRLNDLNPEYYNHYEASLETKYELSNGLLIHGGAQYDWYIPLRDKVTPLIQNQYRTFAPVIGLRWTPGQFYRFQGNRKEYLHSRFPSFFVEYARGLQDVLHSNSHFERIEVDIQQKIPLGLMRSFHYYVGAGYFTNVGSVYFAEFSNFRRKNIPQSWDDPIGGTFHILGGDWYNASNSYVQAHFMYESPFSIFRLFRRIVMDIVTERIYVSQLYTPLLPCYTEIGYGVGNFLGNAGVFVSFDRGRYKSVGAKIVIEL